MNQSNVQGRGFPGWVIALTMALAAVAIVYMGWQRLKPAPERHLPPEARIVVRYEGHNWLPVDVALATRMPDDQMVMVGMNGRLTLWANKAVGLGGGGGGGGRLPAGLETGAYHRIYVKLDDGRFLPMMWLSAAPGRD